MKQSICFFEGCLRPHYALGLCNAHWQQSHKGKPLVQIKRTEDLGHFCHYSECGRPNDRRGWCQMHYKQLLRGETMRPIRAKRSHVGIICYIPSCGKAAKTGDACLSHANIAYNFDISRERLIELFSDPFCGICGNQRSAAQELHIDHDHTCCRGCDKCVRGLLCGNCNRALGIFGDDIERIQRAIEYLERTR